MTNKKRKILLLIIMFIAMFLFATKTSSSSKYESPEETVLIEPEVVNKLSHRQEVWLYALEWCECSGVHTAVNPNDLDGTPSFYAFQFKPDTFRGYGEKYGIIEPDLGEAELMELLKSYELQREIVKNMMFDPSVKWSTQFPHCVKKLGFPPKS